MDEMLGEEHAPGLRHCNGRGSEMLKEQSVKLAFAYSEAFRQYIHAGGVAVKRSFKDQGKGARDGI